MKSDNMEKYHNDALRYLRVRGDAPEELRVRVEQTMAELARSMPPRFTYRAFPAEHAPDGVRLAGSAVTLTGELAARMLRECGTAVLLACTLGAAFEQRLRALESRDMGEAAILDACASAWVEYGCDLAESEIAARFPGRYLTDRFSPGYGDLPLALQPSVLDALDASRRLGVHAGESLLMLPSKSVTAILGVADRPQPARVRGCAYCSMKETCAYRKGGTSCAV